MAYRSLSYPLDSPNINKRRWDFWNDLGMDIEQIDDLRALSQTLKTTTLEKKPVNEYRKDFTKLGEEVEGEMSVDALSQVDLFLEEGEEVTVRAFEASSWPEEVYDIRLEAVDPQSISERKREVYERGSIVLTDVPPEVDDRITYGGVYDFTPIHFGSYIVEPVDTERKDFGYN